MIPKWSFRIPLSKPQWSFRTSIGSIELINNRFPSKMEEPFVLVMMATVINFTSFSEKGTHNVNPLAPSSQL